MRLFIWLLKAVVGIAVLAVAGLFAWLYAAPPELIRVGSGYAAKIVCSNVFIAGRDPDEVLEVDVQAPGHPLLKLMRVSVDRDAKTVKAGLLGVLGQSTAIARDGLGCASVPDGDLEQARAVQLSQEPVASSPSEASWPVGERAGPVLPGIAAIVGDDDLAGPGMRAIVVVQDGKIVAERYGAGFSEKTPLLGWSMSKTVNAAIIGTLIREGRMSVDASRLFPGWDGDGRADVTIADLMAMSSGLVFNEDYGAVADVTRMLYLEPDMASFAATKELGGPVGEVFSYSSGTSVMLSRLWQQALDDPQQALQWPRRALFGPLGMSSAVIEADARGTFVGSSYIYATARDWARFGQFLLDDGVWNSERILPAGFVSWMREPAPASSGVYGRGQLWLEAPGGNGSRMGVPADTFWLKGHDGQTIAVIPSRRMVVVRMGLTPRAAGYGSELLVAALATALTTAGGVQ